MQKSDGGFLFSASDLVNFAACAHLTHLDLANLVSPLPKAEDTEEMVLIQGKGFEHESRYLGHLRSEVGEVVDLQDDALSDLQASQKTRAALEGGAPVVFQGTFLEPPWVGHADFLVRVDSPSLLGAFSYEVEDTKLARTSRGKFLVQLCLYSEMLASAQGVMSRHVHVVLGDGRKDTFLVADYLRYYRQLKQRFLDWTSNEDRDSSPERSDRCSMCRWRELCTAQWERDDHLNRVAGISRQQIAKLRSVGISTMNGLATLKSGSTVARIQPDTLGRLSQQARLQVQAQATGQPQLELVPAIPGKGFERMPAPADGDLFFDMEGDPLEEGGLEYLFGLYFFENGTPVFKPFWAHSRDEERTAFEAFVDYVTDHLARHPEAHIYHYAPYEPTALKRLMCLHGTRESQVDDLLRRKKLVDLYAVVREAIRVGEPSYSIKAIERFYRGARSGDVQNAGASIVFYEKWKVSQDPAVLQAIEDYNKDDVVSTFQLREWLLSLRPKAAALTAPAVTAPAKQPQREKSQAALEAERELESYRTKLLGDAPADRLEWTNEHHVRELLFQLLGFHRRAEKPQWWALFARQDASEEELLDDIEVIACLEHAHAPISAGKGWHCAYSYPEQEFKLKTGDNCCIVQTMQEAQDVVIDEENRLVTFTVGGDGVPPRRDWSLGSGRPIPTNVIQNAYKRFVDAYLAGDDRYGAGVDLVHRAIPRVAGTEQGEPLLRPGEDLVAGTARVSLALASSYLFVQGPPGAGKTYTGSHVIAELLRAGKKVAVASNSHKAINNLLQAVEKVTAARGQTFCGAKKSSGEDTLLRGSYIKDFTSTNDIAKKVSGFQLVAGTAWLFSSASLGQPFDYLFIDEAGQVSLANLLAMATCTKNIVLLGDQMQLSQPIQGVHAGESGQSTLDYLLQGEATVAPHAGVFLKDTWRMHPDVCRFISDAVYDGRLEAEPANANQRLLLGPGAHEALRPTGVRFLPVEHDACSQRSEVEADVIRAMYTSLLQQHYIDREGRERQMDLPNVLVVAPYNQQVNWLKRVLPESARVGTVDKFQGQEAEVVLVSMTTSSGEHLPRNLEFLYSKNRLNVAISRARCLAVVVASPKLLDVECGTPQQMALVNTLCWVRDYSREQHPNETPTAGGGEQDPKTCTTN
jgi:predicted RecB family nuclease